MSEHTPTPWRVVGDEFHYDSATDIVGPNNDVIAQTCGEWAPMVPNAAHIVRCVNAYDELLDALQRCAVILPRYVMFGKTTGEDEELSAVLETVNEALAKAG